MLKKFNSKLKGLDLKNFKFKDLKKLKIKFHLGKKVNAAADKLVEKEPQKIRNLRNFAHNHMGLMIATFAIFVVVTIGSIWVVNYNTAYEYSYNGKTLGVVKDKNDVLRITSLVSTALSDDKNVEVVIDDEKDIKFKKVAIIGKDIHIDSSEDVLRRLTYVGDIKVNGYGITVDGKTAAILDSQKSADNVLDTIKAEYLQVEGQAIVEDTDFIESVAVKEITTNLENLQTEEEAVNRLKTGGTQQIMHPVAEGETFASIAETHGVTEEKLRGMNPSVDDAAVAPGIELLVMKPGPMITMEASQLVTYEEEIPFEIVETKTDELYKGDIEVTEAGSNGYRVVTARIESKNGEVTSTTPIVEIVKSKPVTQYQLVGTAERPYWVGDGTFNWPAKAGTYRISSEFGARWGRNHNGIDMACSPGTNVYAADGGIVEHAGSKGSFGLLVIIDHQNGYRTYYAHNSKLLVKKGQKVAKGHHIAESGNTGRSTGPHIHFEVRTPDTPKNPRRYLP